VDEERFRRVARALADPRRVDILDRLAREEEMTCSALVPQIGLSQPTVSHHLKELVLAELLDVRPEGQFNLYRLRREVLAEFADSLRARFALEKT